MSRRVISGWGLYPAIEACVEQARFPADLPALVRRGRRLLPQGNCRSYGDACLYPRVASMLGLRHLLAFDAEQGRLRAEAGITLDRILRFTVPRGWFLPVTPGTKFPTLGGCLAADVHGKNHHVDGTLGRYVEELEMVLADGSWVRCSANQHAGLFEATLGGMGLTGFIYAATVRLRRIESSWIRVRSLRVSSFAELCRLFAQTSAQTTYSVAWIDCLARGGGMGRGILMLGEHLGARGAGRAHPLRPHGEGGIDVPCHLPGGLLNSWSMRAFNALYYHRQVRAQVTRVMHYDPFFYPLDTVGHWNRIYGRDGFLQYQFVVPFQDGEEVLQEVLGRIAARGAASFLAVLKTLGPERGLLSFPMPGYTLALDIPLRDGGVIPFLRDLNRTVIRAGGRSYLAKDAILQGEEVEAMYPRLPEFRQVRHRYDPAGLFRSALSDRLGLS
ncbi:MAG: FAD-binding oxidoreductase [Candidatus Latescibacterota bacterium]